ncbi:MAG: hypothetical protein SCH66_14935 [Methanolobus sp.]|nr:hypothetical protein [Methanolobus sp.]
MADTTTKEQVIEGTLKGMDEIYQTRQSSAFIYAEVREYVKRRLDRAYELGYSHGINKEE